MSEKNRYYSSDGEFTDVYPYGIMDDDDIEKVINSIIEKRHKQLPEIKRTENQLTSIIESINAFKDKKDSFLASRDDNMWNGFSVSERQEIRHNIDNISDEDINGVIKKMLTAKQKVCDLRRRFDKDNICIAIVGGARNGKSRLIQTITGLDDKVVPTSEDDFCTGTRSTIENSNEFKAEVEFFTEKELLSDIISKYKEKFPQASDITLNNIDDIEKLYNKLRSLESNEGSQYIDKLRVYFKHKDAYEKYLGSDNKILHEEEKDEIRKYVSQESSDGEEKYYRCLSVKRVKIYCKFPVTKVSKIVLVDTIGLGENSLGIEEQMLETVSKEADFVLMIHKMGISSTDILKNVHYDIYNSISDSIKVAPNKWLYWVFNRDERYYTKTTFEKRYVKNIEEKLSAKRNYPGGILNVDCSNEEDVKENLMKPMLSHLANNLHCVDEYYKEMTNNAIKLANFEYKALIGNLKTVSMSSNDKYDLQLKKANEAHEMLTRELNKSVEKYRGDAAVLVPLYDVGKIIARMHKAVPSVDEIEEYRKGNYSFLDTINDSFECTQMNLRTMVSNEVDKYDEIVHNFKVMVIKDVLQAAGIKEDMIGLNFESDTFIEDMTKQIFNNSEHDRKLVERFNQLQEFSIKDKLDLTDKLNEAIHEYLDVNHHLENDGLFPKSWNNSSKDSLALHLVLLSHVSKIQGKLLLEEERLKNLPINALKDEYKEFVRQIVNYRNKDGWQTYYVRNATIIWKDEFEELESKSKTLKAWNDLIADLIQYEELKLLQGDNV